jgi:hypothetical protein
MHYFPHPVSICLTNPLARFSFLPDQDPRRGIILGICAVAGINEDDLLSVFHSACKPFLPGPCFRSFNPDMRSYCVSLKNAGSRAGHIDQLARAIDTLKRNPADPFTVSLRDPRQSIDQGSGVAVSACFYFDHEFHLNASVYVPELDVVKQFAAFIIPTYTFVQQAVALLLGRKLGRFYVVSDRIQYVESDISQTILKKSVPRIQNMKDFEYEETRELDLRYLDMVMQHLISFIQRIRSGDLLVENPFKHSGHLEMLHDYGEAFRYGEALDRDISWDSELGMKHPQLAYFYDL